MKIEEAKAKSDLLTAMAHKEVDDNIPIDEVWDLCRADLAYKDHCAMLKGNIRNIGGVIVDKDSTVIEITFDDLYFVISGLVGKGYDIQRVDSGGIPEWCLLSYPDIQ